MHGLIFETSVCYWQDQPDFYSFVLLAKRTGRRAQEETSQKDVALSRFLLSLFLVSL